MKKKLIVSLILAIAMIFTMPIVSLQTFDNNSNDDYVCYAASKTKLSTPLLNISNNNKGYPKLTWGKVKNAMLYDIYRATSKNGTYKKIWSTSSLSYTNSSVKKGTTYYYKIKAVPASNSKKYTSSKFSRIVSAKKISPETAISVVDGSTYTIGFFAPMSSAAAAADGASAYNAAKLAVKLQNENGGINGKKIVLRAYDDGLDTTEAANIAHKLAYDNSVNAIVSGSYAGPTKVAAPLVQEARKVMISAYMPHQDIACAGDYVFEQSLPFEMQGKAAAKFVSESINAKKVAILNVDLDFATKQVNAFKGYLSDYCKSIKVVYEQSFRISEYNLESAVKAAIDSGAEVIYAPCYYEQTSEIIRQTRISNSSMPIIGCTGGDCWMVKDIAYEYLDNYYVVTAFNRDNSNPVTQQFIDEYHNEYGIDADYNAAMVFESFQVLFKGLESGVVTQEQLSEYIQNIRNYSSVSGMIEYYDSNGHAIREIYVQKYENGKYHNALTITDTDIIYNAYK